MIFDRIDRKIKDMQNLKALELSKINRQKQVDIDQRYDSLVNQVRKCSLTLAYARDHLQFPISETVKLELQNLLGNLTSIVSDGCADEDSVLKAASDFKNAQGNIKKDWGKHFVNYTSTTVNTLRVISGIDPERINKCIAEIKAAETWTEDKSILDTLQKAINSADGLIRSLKMDQATISFLTKMTSGKATIADLDENILKWIRAEGLERKIRITFLPK